MIGDLNQFANSFMKNRGSTTEKYYIMKHWASSVSAKVSMGMYNLFGRVDGEEALRVKDACRKIPAPPVIEASGFISYLSDTFKSSGITDDSLKNHFEMESDGEYLHIFHLTR